ncbi:MAG: branched-chain amino acid ABC transporter permease [Dehalococcoidia bacterium]|jgi:branched-chain amino acid transport system permease protein
MFANLLATLREKPGGLKAACYIGLIIVLALLPLFMTSTYYLHMFIVVFIFIMVTSSLRLVALSGQINMGHAAMMCIGAYTSAMLSKYLGWSPWFTIIIGALVTFGVALIVAIPFSRLRGIYFSMVTLFFGLGIISVNSIFQVQTGGYAGLNLIPPLFGIDKLPYYYFFLVFCAVCLLILHRLEFSRIGLTWKAVAQSHPVASSIGINETQQRIQVFAIGSLFAGLAGGIYAHYYMLLAQSTFSFLASLNLLIYMLVGGIGSFAGPIIGAGVLVLIPELFRNLKEFVPYIFCAILLLVLFFAPNGLVGVPAQIKQWLNSRRSSSQSQVRDN